MKTPPIKKYVMDANASWEERYEQLQAHHETETQWYAHALEDDVDMAALSQEALALAAAVKGFSFQARVKKWSLACFGEAIAMDKTERNHRFLEEALELVQALNCTASEAHQLVDYVFGRPVGEVRQELGGVMVTLAALCNANDLDRDIVGEHELERVWGKLESIREKQKKKPKHSPLPGPSAKEDLAAHRARTDVPGALNDNPQAFRAYEHLEQTQAALDDAIQELNEYREAMTAEALFERLMAVPNFGYQMYEGKKCITWCSVDTLAIALRALEDK